MRFKLPDDSNILQAEIHGKRSEMVTASKDGRRYSAIIVTDSRLDMYSLHWISLNKMALYSNIALGCVRGHGRSLLWYSTKRLKTKILESSI